MAIEYDGITRGIFYASRLNLKDLLSLPRDVIYHEMPIAKFTTEGSDTGSTAIYRKESFNENQEWVQLRRDYLVKDSNGLRRRLTIFSESKLAELSENSFKEIFENLNDGLDETMHMYCEDIKLIPKGWLNLIPYQNLEL